MINDMHNGIHYLDESVKSVITNLYSLETLQKKSCDGCVYDDGIFCIVACSRRFNHDSYTKKEQ